MPDLLLWILASLELVIGLGWIFLLFYNARELSSYPNFVLEGPSTRNEEELVSVIVPTRNEEATIATCLRSIAGQTHRNLEFVVVDDMSTDRTAEKAASVAEGDGRGRMVHGEELPEGWVGKNWACHQGFRMSRGEWLLFVDSDSILARDAVERTLSHAKRNGKYALSVFPRGELRGFWAKMVWPVLASVIRLLYPLRSVNDSKGRRAVLFGAFILIKREAYERIGGHLTPLPGRNRDLRCPEHHLPLVWIRAARLRGGHVDYAGDPETTRRGIEFHMARKNLQAAETAGWLKWARVVSC